MVRPERELLSGVVELDEVFIGNESRGRAGSVKDNCAAMIAVESMPGRKIGRVRIEVTPTARSADLLAFADRVIAKGSLIKTDGAILRKLAAMGYQHQFFVGVDTAEPAHVNLPGVHMIASLLKRWLTGTLHYAVSQEHLAYYLDEYTSGSTGESRKAAGSCSIDCCSRRSTPTRIHSLSCEIPLRRCTSHSDLTQAGSSTGDRNLRHLVRTKCATQCETLHSKKIFSGDPPIFVAG